MRPSSRAYSGVKTRSPLDVGSDARLPGAPAVRSSSIAPLTNTTRSRSRRASVAGILRHVQPYGCAMRRMLTPMPTVRREIVLPVPRERAWDLLTDPDELRERLAEDAELDPEPGAAAPCRI